MLLSSFSFPTIMETSDPVLQELLCQVAQDTVRKYQEEQTRLREAQDLVAKT